MIVFIALLRGINLAAHHRVKMEALRGLFESLGLKDVQTHLQSGNVLFRASGRSPAALRKRIEEAIEGQFGFHSDCVLRTPQELREAAARNPYAARPGMEPSRLAVHFLVAEPGAECCAAVLKIRAEPEELHIAGRELFVYYPNGMAHPTFSMAQVERALKTSGTSRNWNTVRKLVEMAAKLESI